LSYTIIASIVLFIANVPCLWFAPNAAVILMALSIFTLAPVPVFLARMAVE
jgi:cell division protein FtsW (lipid II flippase)